LHCPSKSHDVLEEIHQVAGHDGVFYDLFHVPGETLFNPFSGLFRTIQWLPGHFSRTPSVPRLNDVFGFCDQVYTTTLLKQVCCFHVVALTVESGIKTFAELLSTVTLSVATLEHLME
jgi:hypothetical protein